MPKHNSNQICPICMETILQHVHCSSASCAFFVTACPRCDREQAVRAFIADHEKDCEQIVSMLPVRRVA